MYLNRSMNIKVKNTYAITHTYFKINETTYMYMYIYIYMCIYICIYVYVWTLALGP